MRLFKLASGAFPGKHIVRFFADARRCFASKPFDKRLDLLTPHALHRSGHNNGFPRKRASALLFRFRCRRNAVRKKAVDLCGD